MPWATSRVGRTVNQTFDLNNDGRVGWLERGLGAVGVGTGLGLGYYGARAMQAGAGNFQMPSAVRNAGQYVEQGLNRLGSMFNRAPAAPAMPGYNYRGNEVDSGPNPYVRPPDVPIQPAGDYTPGGSTRRSGWANSGNRRTGGAFATPVGPGATSAERRTNMITGGYNGVGGLLSMGSGRAALGQSSLSMRNPTVQNQAR